MGESLRLLCLAGWSALEREECIPVTGLCWEMEQF